MAIYAWVTPAFIPKVSPVDHTWITTYDSKSNAYVDLKSVVGNSENFWFCWGDFHIRGNPVDWISSVDIALPSVKCFIKPNDKKQRGSIHWYGIDGVCHQVANQVMYLNLKASGGTPLTVHKARGYKLSTALYGIYGRRKKEWDTAVMECGVAPKSIANSRNNFSTLSRRASIALGVKISDSVIKLLDDNRKRYLQYIDDVGFASRAPNETSAIRADKINGVINEFFSSIRSVIQNDEAYKRIVGINAGEEVGLVDPDLFEFPEPTDRPERNSKHGW